MALSMEYVMPINYVNVTLQNEEGFKEHFPELESTLSKTITINNAYFKIDKLSGDKNRIDLTINIYKDSAKSLKLDSKFYAMKPNVTDESLNFIKQGYLFLKSLEEFASAVDVLEEGQNY